MTGSRALPLQALVPVNSGCSLLRACLPVPSPAAIPTWAPRTQNVGGGPSEPPPLSWHPMPNSPSCRGALQDESEAEMPRLILASSGASQRFWSFFCFFLGFSSARRTRERKNLKHLMLGWRALRRFRSAPQFGPRARPGR